MRIRMISAIAVLLTLSGAIGLPVFAGDDEPTPLVEDVTGSVDLTTTLATTDPIPPHADGIGPGSHLLIDIPSAGTFRCTANFVWRQGSTYYLGAAGHCFLPESATATHGPGTDYDASGVTVRACIARCEADATISLLGQYVALGRVAYARQATGTEDVGHDFGVVRVPNNRVGDLRPEMPVWGGPDAGYQRPGLGARMCHYGNGVGAGEVTKARAGVFSYADDESFEAVSLVYGGDSGSAALTCNGSTYRPAGVVTHGLVTGGLSLGTTVPRAIEMAEQADLTLRLVLP